MDSISQAQPAERLMNNQFIKGENDWMSGTLGDDVEMTRDVFLTTCVVAEMKDLLNQWVKNPSKKCKKIPGNYYFARDHFHCIARRRSRAAIRGMMEHTC